MLAQSQLTATSASQAQAVLPPQPPKQLGPQVHATTPGQFFVFLVEMQIHHVAQADLKPLNSSNLPSLTS